MLTNDMVSSFASLAGDRFDWEGVRGCSRPPSTYRRALRDDIAARQGGLCPQCGNALDATAEFCHIVARGPAVRGWMPGNIFVGHAACNAATKPQHDETGRVVSGVPVLTVDYFVRPDIIVTEWTPAPILRDRQKGL